MEDVLLHNLYQSGVTPQLRINTSRTTEELPINKTNSEYL